MNNKNGFFARFTPQRSRLIIWGVIGLIVMSNLGAIIDLVLHPEIDYFDSEHIIVGGATALVFGIMFVLITIYIERLEKAFRKISQSEDTLRESEEKFRSLLDSQESNILVLDYDGVHHYLNQAGIASITGSATAQNIIGKRLHDLYPAHDADWQLEQIRRVITTGQGMSGDFQNVVNGQSSWWHLNLQPIRNASGQVVQVMVNSHDITERKQAEEALQMSEAKYRVLTENMKDVVWTMDTETMRFLYVSPSVQKLRGYTAEEIIAEPITAALMPDAVNAIQEIIRKRIADFRSGLISSDDYFTIRLEQPCKDGSTVWVEQISNYYLNKESGHVEVRSVTRDITERRQAEDKLRASEERHRSLIENMSDIVMEVDVQGNYCYISPNYAVLSGYSVEEELGKSAFMHVHPDDLPPLLQKREKAKDTGKLSMSYRVQNKNGELRWIETSGKPYLTADGEPRIIIVTRDITERKQAEDKLRASEERYRSLIENMSDIVMEVDAQGIYCYVSPNYATLSGYSLEEELGGSAFKHIHPDDLPLLLQKMEKVINSEQQSMAYRVQNKNGEWRWVETSGKPYHASDGSLHVISVTRDITERRQVEEKLRESEERYRGLFNVMDEGLAINEAVLDENGDVVDYIILSVNPAFEKQTIYKTEEVLGKRATEVYQMSPAYIRDWWRSHSQFEGSAHTEMYHEPSKRWFHVTTTPPEGKRFVTIFMDITSRKQAEEALRESEANLRAVFNATDESIIMIDSNYTLLALNDIAVQRIGPARELIGRKVTDLFPADVAARRKPFIERVLLTGERVRFDDERNGRWMANHIHPILDADGHVARLAIYSRDITQRKHGEEALRKSKEQYENLVSKIPVGIYILRSTPQGSFSLDYASTRMAEMFNLSVESLLADSRIIFQKIHPQDRDGFIKLNQEGIEQKQSFDWTGRVLVEEDVRWLHFSSTPEMQENGDVLWHGLIADITEQTLANETVRESEEKWRSLVNASPDFIALHDKEGRFLFLNHYADGFTEKDVLGTSLYQYLLPESVDTYRSHMEKALNTWMVQKFEYTAFGDHGTTKVYDEYLIPILNNQEINILSIARDITERKQTEDKIKKISQHYQALIEKAPDGLVLLNAEGNFKYVSPGTKKMFGYDASYETTGNPTEFIHPDDLPRVLAELSKLLQDPSYVPTLQYRYIDKSGNWKWVESTFSNLLANPNIESIIINFRDITESKQAEEALQESEDKFRSLIDQSTDGVVLIDEQGAIIEWNTAEADITGIPRAHALGAPFWEIQYQILTPSRREKTNPEFFKKFFFESFQTGKTELLGKPMDVEIESVIGEHKFIQQTSFLVKTETGNRVGAIVRDITERKQAEEEIRLQAAIVENMTEGVLLIRANDGAIVYTNSAIDRVFGYSPQELIGKPISAINTPTDKSPEEVATEIARDLKVHGGWKGELQNRKKDGSALWCYVNISAFEHPRYGKVWVSIHMDISDRKQVEQELAQYTENLEAIVGERTRELREAQEQLIRHEKLAVLGQMASSVGHELRNPLGIIASAIYYLRLVQPGADEKVKQYLGIIDQEVRTSEKIITDLLDFARIKSVDRVPVSVSELIRQTLERFPAPPTVQVAIDISNDLPLAFVDVRQITQVLGNLVLNAYQAMVDPTADVPNSGQLSLCSEMQNDMIKITVQDNGVGIPPENMKKLFEPLFTTKPKGIGLGLIVSRKLVDANEGRIEFESEAGVGSSFHVYLPIDKENE